MSILSDLYRVINSETIAKSSRGEELALSSFPLFSYLLKLRSILYNHFDDIIVVVVFLEMLASSHN